MGKFSAGTVVDSRQQRPEVIADDELEVGKLQQPAPTPVQEDNTIQQFLDQQTTTPAADPELQQQVDTGIEAGLAIEEEGQREAHRIPTLRERQEGPQPTRWLETPKSSKEDAFNARIVTAAKNALNGALTISAEPPSGPAARALKAEGPGPQVAAAYEPETAQSSLPAILHKLNAVTVAEEGYRKPVPTPQFSMIAAAAAENIIADASFGELDTEVDFGTDLEVEQKPKNKRLTPFPKAAGNAQLGQQVALDWQRTQGISTPSKLSTKEAEILGAAAKELWVRGNEDLIKTETDPKTGQAFYQLTQDGQRELIGSEVQRKRLFPKANVRPSKTPLPTGQLPGDIGATAVKRQSGAIKKQKSDKQTEKAKANASTIGHVVDKQRTKILYSTILPVLLSEDYTTWQAEIYGVGTSKHNDFKARMETTTDPDYNPDKELEKMINDRAQEVQAIAVERNGANYLTYYTQSYNGRIAPQQSVFDPTNSKIVRFVTRNPTPVVVKPKSRQDNNLRQMYAMMLVDGADTLLPNEREIKLNANASKLAHWGNRLGLVLDQTISDDTLEQISAAIDQGLPLNDQNFPQIPLLALDPVQDAELIKAIENKGEDGPAFIDGLIDFAKYSEANHQNRPYASYFNAYIDGKTNGIASNGIQMGHFGTAERTGVIRNSTTKLLDKDLDIRDQLKEVALDTLNNGGLDGNFGENYSDFKAVTSELVASRKLNKHITMTWGYGKDIETFGNDITEAISKIATDKPKLKPSIDRLRASNLNKTMIDTILNLYDTSLQQVISPDAIESRAIVRSASMLAAAMNQIFRINSPTGSELLFGRELSTGVTGDSPKFSIVEEGKVADRVNVPQYGTEPSAAAARRRENPETGKVTYTPGEFAWGGAVPGPVQSIDAATVTKTLTGKSWERLKAASGGNPYIHPIYDAFKMDANGYDVVLEEVNQNWLDAGMNWSYLEETQKSIQDGFERFKEDIKSRDPNSPVKPNERLYMDWFLEPSINRAGKTYYPNLLNKISKLGLVERDSPQIWAIHNNIVKTVKSAGYDPANPSADITVKQLEAFVNVLKQELKFDKRIYNSIAKTNKNKKELKEEILKRGYKTPSGKRIPLQYYSH